MPIATLRCCCSRSLTHSLAHSLTHSLTHSRTVCHLCSCWECALRKASPSVAHIARGGTLRHWRAYKCCASLSSIGYDATHVHQHAVAAAASLTRVWMLLRPISPAVFLWHQVCTWSTHSLVASQSSAPFTEDSLWSFCLCCCRILLGVFKKSWRALTIPVPLPAATTPHQRTVRCSNSMA